MVAGQDAGSPVLRVNAVWTVSDVCFRRTQMADMSRKANQEKNTLAHGTAARIGTITPVVSGSRSAASTPIEGKNQAHEMGEERASVQLTGST